MKSKSFVIKVPDSAGKVSIYKIGKTKFRMLLEALKDGSVYNLEHIGTKLAEVDYDMEDLKKDPDAIITKHNLNTFFDE